MPWFTAGIISVVALLILGCGVYIGVFNDLTYDDFHRNTYTDSSWFERYYGFGTGRFTNGLMVLHPQIYELEVYRLLHIANIAVWIAGIWVFWSTYFRFLEVESPPWALVLFISVFFTAMTSNAPNLGEWWFWYATASYYMFGVSMFLFWLSGMFAALKSGKMVHWILTGVLVFFAAGVNELLMFIGLVVTGLVMVVTVVRRGDSGSVLPFVGAVAGAAIVFLSPGTSSRVREVTGNSVWDQFSSKVSVMVTDLPPALLAGFSYWTDDTVWLWTGLIFLAVGLVAVPSAIPRRVYLNALRVLGTSSIIMILIGVLVVLLDYKININDPSRYNNIAYCLFLGMISLNAFNIGLVLGTVSRVHELAATVGIPLLLAFTVILGVSAFRSYNVEVMLEDIRLNKPARQAASIRHWKEIAERAKAAEIKEVVVPNMVPAHTLTVYRYGPKMEESYYFNRLWGRYFGLSHQTFSKRHFDRDLLKAVMDDYRPLEDQYRLSSFRDHYRNYLLVQVPENTGNTASFCVSLVGLPETSSAAVRDETHRNLLFDYKDNEHCTDFHSRRLYCEPHAGSWICRIPLPLSYTGPVRTSWDGSIRELQIN